MSGAVQQPVEYFTASHRHVISDMYPDTAPGYSPIYLVGSFSLGLNTSQYHGMSFSKI